jgi:hypothetical protein
VRGEDGGGPKESIGYWVETRARSLRDAAGQEYLAGAGSEEALAGRRQSLITIERFIDRRRMELVHPDRFVLEVSDLSRDYWVRSALREHFIRKRYPFLTSTSGFHLNLERCTKERRKEVTRAFWADAVGLPHDARFDRIYGAMLRAAPGHPIKGDEDYKRLEALLAEVLREGNQIVRLGDRVFQYSEDRWRAMRTDPGSEGEATWSEGWIISRNHGRLVVPPHRRDGTLVPGYTRNGPGEGPSTRRASPLHMRCIERPLSGTDLMWIHAYHAWELSQA